MGVCSVPRFSITFAGRAVKTHVLIHCVTSTAVALVISMFPTVSDTYRGFAATGLDRKVAIQATSRGARVVLKEPIWIIMEHKVAHVLF